MSKRLKIYLAIFIAVIALMMYLEYTAPKPVDWTPTYSAKDKIPFGAYVLAHEMPKLFPDKKIQFIEDQTPAAFLASQKNIGTDNIYFIISPYNELSEADQKALLAFVEKGNDVFLSCFLEDASILRDSLKYDTDIFSSFSSVKEEDLSDVLQFYLSNSAFKDQKFKFKKVTGVTYFNKVDTAKAVVLGEFLTLKNERKVNFISQKYGKGTFYLQLFTEPYSNYFILNDKTYEYAVNSLNYINKKNILWNDYKTSINTPQESILKYIFANPPLHWAWVILLIGAVFYCLFFGKRLQRIIPIINPLQNTTVEFTKTIGNLYYNNREHQDLVEKKIKYFLYLVKERYFMDIENINADFSEKLHLKSGVSKEITDKIVFLIQRSKAASTSSENDLKTLNETIDLFYRKSGAWQEKS